MERINFKEKRNFSEIMNITFAFLRQEFRPMLRILLITVAPAALIMGISLHLFLMWVTDLPQMINNPDLEVDSVTSGIFFKGGIAYVFYLISSILVSAVVFGYIKIYVDQKPESFGVKNILKYLKWDFWRLLLAAFVLAIMGLFIQIIVNIIPFIGLLFYLIIMIFINAITYLTYKIMVYERKGFFRSFSRSFDLIADYWWVSFGLVAVTMIIQMSLTVSVGAPSGIAYGIYMYHSIKTADELMVYSSPVLNVISAVFTVLASILIFLLQTISLTAMAFHYFNLVESKEGPGLMEQIDKIGTVQLADEELL